MLARRFGVTYICDLFSQDTCGHGVLPLLPLLALGLVVLECLYSAPADAISVVMGRVWAVRIRKFCTAYETAR